jgi:hypothetical protein
MPLNIIDLDLFAILIDFNAILAISSRGTSGTLRALSINGRITRGRP